MRRSRLFGVAGLALAATIFMLVGAGVARADNVQHGIAFTKGCASPTQIGQPYTCTYSIRNNTDEAHDTVVISGLNDTVHGGGGNQSSGNAFSSLKFQIGAFESGFSTPPTCTGGSGSGTLLDPFTGATSCTLPFGSRLNVLPFSFYTVQAADFALPGHLLSDSADLTWHDNCDDPLHTGNSNCVSAPPTVGAGSQTVVTALTSTTATTIHNAAHQAVTAVAVGTTVHDFVTVTGQPGNPVPTGNVTIDWFLNNTCTAPIQQTSAPIALGAGGTVDATGFAFTVNSAGGRAFKAHYAGDGTYLVSDGPCEPLNVVDANIQITPSGVNHIGNTHTFTAHVNVNPGSGQVNAPDGTTITFSNPPGGSCTTAGGTGSCSVSYTSNVTRIDTVTASTTVSVGGVTLTRTTDGVAPNSGPAIKRWVNARIQITPNATNAVGQPHTFVVTLQQDIGDGAGFVAFPNQHVDVTLTGAGGATAVPNAAASTCDDAGPNTNASGQCTITFTSNTPGTVTGHATSSVSVMGSAAFTVATNGVAPNSADAIKTFVNANIQITPANATNPVGTTHVLTITVNAVGGTIDAGPHTATASITSGPGSFVGSPTCTYTGGAATASCTVTITSSVAGTTVVSATSNIPVAGVTISRTTDGTSGSSGPANKLWIALTANVRTDVHSATHVVISTAQAGDVIHDKAFVTKGAGVPAAAPAPTGTITFHRFTSLNCTGASVDETVPLAADGTAESSGFTVTADLSYRADYSGDANYPAASGACEPLSLQQTTCPSCAPPPCPAFPVFPGQPGPGGPCSFPILTSSIKGTLMEIEIQNASSNNDGTLTKLHVTWPAANGALKSVSMNGYLYTGPPLTGGSADLTFTTDPLTRNIPVGQSQKLRLIFEKTADTNTAHYTASAEFGTCVIPIF